MQTYARKLLVVITEAALEKRLAGDARALGAQGYTVTDCRGSGQHGERESTWAVDRSIEIKIVCDAAVVDKLAEHLLTTYAPHYAMTLFVTDAAVFRPQKF